MRKLTSNDIKSIPWLYRRMQKHMPALMLITVSDMARSALGVGFALCTQKVIDSAVAGLQGGQINPAFFSAAGLLGATIIGQLLCSLVNELMTEGLSIKLERDLRHEFFHQLLRADYASLSQYHSGDLVNRMNSDVGTVNSGVMYFIPATLSLIVTFIMSFIALSKRAPRFTFILLAATIIVASSSLLFRKKVMELTKLTNQSNGRYTGYIQEILENLLMVHALDVSAQVERKADKLHEERERIRREKRKLSLILSTSMPVISYFISFGTLMYCAIEIMHGRMSVGSLTALTQLASYVQGPVYSLPGLARQMMTTGGAAERLMEIDRMAGEGESQAMDVKLLMDDAVSIGAEHLSFRYSEEKREAVLEDISFELPLDGMSVITGPSGVGKSTLLKLLLGVYRPQKGRLFLRYRDGRKKTLNRGTRSVFTYAPQGNLLLSGTLRENILIANETASEDQLKEAVYISTMDEYLEKLPDGLETKIGENARGLSEGQAQRLSLARAIISDSPVMLMDEVTSSLDRETERKVVERLKSLKSRTCIIVTHRPAPLQMADWEMRVERNCVTVRKVQTREVG